MRRSLTQKAQIMVIMNGTAGIATHGKLTLIANNHYGYFIKTKDLMLDKEKLVEIKPEVAGLSPEDLKRDTSLAKEKGRAALKYSETPIVKLETEDKKHAWVNAEYLKEFGTDRKYFVKDDKSPIFITDKKDKPLGMILPIKFPGEMGLMQEAAADEKTN